MIDSLGLQPAAPRLEGCTWTHNLPHALQPEIHPHCWAYRLGQQCLASTAGTAEGTLAVSHAVRVLK